MPSYYLQTRGGTAYSNDWDFSRYTPDMMIINLGEAPEGNDPTLLSSIAFRAASPRRAADPPSLFRTHARSRRRHERLWPRLWPVVGGGLQRDLRFLRAQRDAGALQAAQDARLRRAGPDEQRRAAARRAAGRHRGHQPGRRQVGTARRGAARRGAAWRGPTPAQKRPSLPLLTRACPRLSSSSRPARSTSTCAARPTTAAAATPAWPATRAWRRSPFPPSGPPWAGREHTDARARASMLAIEQGAT